MAKVGALVTLGRVKVHTKKSFSASGILDGMDQTSVLPLPAVDLGISYLAPLGLSFPIHQIGIMMEPESQDWHKVS